MKPWIVTGLLGLFLAQNAPAATTPAGCELHFKVRVVSRVIYSAGSGTGRVTCADAAGNQLTSKPVIIKVHGIGPGLGEFSMRGHAGNVGILDPKEIVGEYAVADANVAVGGGAGASLGFVGQDNGLSFGATVSAGHGWGARLNGSVWEIRLTK